MINKAQLLPLRELSRRESWLRDDPQSSFRAGSIASLRPVGVSYRLIFRCAVTLVFLSMFHPQAS